MCPTCGGWGYFTDCDSWGNDPRVVPCWRGCPEPELPTLADAEAARRPTVAQRWANIEKGTLVRVATRVVEEGDDAA